MSRLSLILFAITAVCLQSAWANHIPTRVADDDFVRKQKSIFELFWQVDQLPIMHPKLLQLGRTWNIKEHIDSFEDPMHVRDLMKKYENGMLPRGKPFSIYYPEILDEAVALYKVLRCAKDFETFLNVAAWARVHINEGMYTYALCVAILHREDTRYVKLPPLYEIMPNLFFNNDVIQKAHWYKMTRPQATKDRLVDKESYVILANHSHLAMDSHCDHEHKLNYFVEDIGLNAYYTLLNLEYPFWMSSADLKIKKSYRGEQYYYALKQLLNRYNLERLSNGLQKVEWLDCHEKIAVGYQPMMSYNNGRLFPNRDAWSMLPHSKRRYLEEVQYLEKRILGSIDFGYVKLEDGKVSLYGEEEQKNDVWMDEGLNVLGNIIEGNEDSVNKKLYGSIDSIYRNILGFSPERLSKYDIVPSSLEHLATTLRDPIFYRLANRIIGYFHRYKSYLKPYTEDQLSCPGVDIESVTVDKLETYFDNYDALINNAVGVNDEIDAQSLLIKARQYRLNHKPFTYHINVNAKQAMKSVIRIFLGPKYDHYGNELPINEAYENFYELDSWVVDLAVGKNLLERNSHEAIFVIPDEESSATYYKKLEIASTGKAPLTYTDRPYGFIDRLILPKGRKEGLPLRLFIHISPFVEERKLEFNSHLWGKGVLDGRVMGYPLDRPLLSENLHGSNTVLKDVLVFHKTADEMNVTTA